MQFGLYFVAFCLSAGICQGRDVYDDLSDMLGRLSADVRYKQEIDTHMKQFQSAYAEASPANVEFDCPSLGPSSMKPQSVHGLRPGDVSAVAAMGDSITAANGALANTIDGVRTQWRGRSWSIGGDDNLDAGVLTLANVIRKLNPKVVGYSLGTGSLDSDGANLNVAVPGNKAIHLPGQAKDLVEKMRNHPDVDFENDWKLVTLFIGGNDLCQFCLDRDLHSPANFVGFIREALDYLHAHLPRTYVNLVTIFDVTPVTDIATGFVCKSVHNIVCYCGYGGKESEHEQAEMAHSYQTLVHEMIKSGRYDDKPDFAVVIQPFFEKTLPPIGDNGKPDMKFWAPDCFHFSEIGHRAAATALWNTMLMPVGSKSDSWDPDATLNCPDSSRGAFYLPTNVDTFEEVEEEAESHKLVGYITMGFLGVVGVVATSVAIFYVYKRSTSPFRKQPLQEETEGSVSYRASTDVDQPGPSIGNLAFNHQQPGTSGEQAANMGEIFLTMDEVPESKTSFVNPQFDNGLTNC